MTPVGNSKVLFLKTSCYSYDNACHTLHSTISTHWLNTSKTDINIQLWACLRKIWSEICPSCICVFENWQGSQRVFDVDPTQYPECLWYVLSPSFQFVLSFSPALILCVFLFLACRCKWEMDIFITQCLIYAEQRFNKLWSTHGAWASFRYIFLDT